MTDVVKTPYWIALASIMRLGPANWSRLLTHFGTDPERIWRATQAELRQSGLDQSLTDEIIIRRSELDPARLAEQTAAAGVHIVTLADESYPTLLRQIHQPPPVLFCRGSLAPLERLAIAVVGTRKYSPYGQQATERLVGDLTQAGLSIVSGLALGIDALAHRACLDAAGLTIAVLGSGVDDHSIFPSSNRYLAQAILDHHGGIVSEYPVGTPPTKFTFPLRNRIIAGLCRGTLIIEAAASSGALITARHALENDRDVFAVPGTIFSEMSEGTNQLIKDGAIPVTAAADILNVYDLRALAPVPAHIDLSALTDDERQIIEQLSTTPLHIDKLSKLCTIKINTLSGSLTMLEMRGIVKDTGGKHYIKCI